ncbi:MAG: peptidoglycan editing factor PgeF [Balneolaceae bacterium]
MNLHSIEIFRDIPGTRAWFTLKNPELVQPGHTIAGLNLGLNSTSDAEFNENRRELFSDPDLSGMDIAIARQVHGTRIVEVREETVVNECDGLVTSASGLLLGIQVADCAAVLVAHPGSGSMGAFHAGWRGAVEGIVPKGVKRLEELYGCSPSELRAWISPSICLKHFEVGAEVAKQFPGLFVDEERWDKPHVDLKGVITSQLVDSGVDKNRIEVHGGCTFCDSREYYSWRREGERAGRMMALIGRVPVQSTVHR